jgi:hypothetical protein
MADSDRKDAAQRMTRQDDFRNAENANVMQQAGASLGEVRAPIPSPADRLTGSQAEREIGRDPNGHDHSPSYQAEVREMEERKAGAESEALREQYAGEGADDTDSFLEEKGKTIARVEGVVGGNPD